jgi:hypothetical protein
MDVPADPQPSQYCAGPPPHGISNFTSWPHRHSSLITVTNSTLSYNSASSPTSSGGGLYLTAGGLLTVSGTSFRGNSAGLFGGAIGLGSDGGSATCALQVLSETAFVDNAAVHGGAQVHMGCTADMVIDAASMALTPASTQVRALPPSPAHFPRSLFVSTRGCRPRFAPPCLHGLSWPFRRSWHHRQATLASVLGPC